MQDYLRPEFEKPHRAGKRTWNGRILKIDRFGNIVTNFHVNDFGNLETRNFTLALGPQAVTALARNYAECGPGELFLILGSSGYYEVSLSQGNAAKHGEMRTRSGDRTAGLVEPFRTKSVRQP